MKSQSHLRRLEVWARPATQEATAEAEPTGDLEVDVIFTDGDGTLTALKTAGVLAHNLRARINLLAFQVVPFAFPLERPHVSIPLIEQHLLDLASQGVQGPLDTTAQLYLCRDKRQALGQVLRPKSVVVIGGRKRWWPTKEQRLAEQLRQEGHQVILAYPQ
jgi:hypothetical protein